MATRGRNHFFSGVANGKFSIFNWMTTHSWAAVPGLSELKKQQRSYKISLCWERDMGSGF